MSAQQQDDSTRTAFAVLIPLIILIVGVVLGVGIKKAHHRKPAAAPAVVAAVAAPASADAEARVVVADGVVKFYFASGKADLAANAGDALGAAVKAAGEGKKLVLSGYHDVTGDAAANAELAKVRALTVQAALVAAGVAETAIELKKPEVLTGTGDNAEARRVELSIR
jgi:outer membrane protein OmpA-like peptidoglycan-associated protein